MTVKEAIGELYNYDNEISKEKYFLSEEPNTEYQKY